MSDITTTSQTVTSININTRVCYMFISNKSICIITIAKMWTDSRVQRIYGGTNEIMKLLIARTL